jgi:hypothetical protein
VNEQWYPCNNAEVILLIHKMVATHGVKAAIGATRAANVDVAAACSLQQKLQQNNLTRGPVLQDDV